jgi:hypothetical protein
MVLLIKACANRARGIWSALLLMVALVGYPSLAVADEVSVPNTPLQLAIDSPLLVEAHQLPAPVTERQKLSAFARFQDYAQALKSRDYDAAYQMLRLSYQASNPRLEWEMALRRRDGLWVDGQMRLMRQSWYHNPQGQAEGIYVAFDFRGDRSDGSLDCGYVVLHQATENAEFTVVRTDTSFVPSHLLTDGVPQVDVLRQLPCLMGKGVATAL